MLNQEAIKDLVNNPKVQSAAPIFQRALQDEHYRNGLIAAANKMVGPEYAQYLSQAIGQFAGTGITQQPLNVMAKQGNNGGLFNV